MESKTESFKTPDVYTTLTMYMTFSFVAFNKFAQGKEVLFVSSELS